MSKTLHPAIHQQGVLVVDDSELQRKSAIALLRRLGVSKIYEAVDGDSALTLMRRLYVPPAIVVLDLEMPGMDGIELVQQLAQDGLHPSFVVLSGAAESILHTVGEMVEALDLPLLGALSKPLSLAHLAEVLARFRSTSEPPMRAVSLSSPPVNADTLGLALSEKRIIPHYQPHIDLKTAEVTGFEALARWQHVSGELIMPGRFIALAEEYGLIDTLTLSMLDAVIADLQLWHSRSLYPSISFNISARSLSDRSFANEIIRRVSDARISPSSLVLEITESALVSDIAAALGTLGRLRLKGFGLAIDDYGTGFSSMQQLSRQPFTTLKIDRSFVHHAHQKWNLRAILQSAIEMGHRLGLATIAEGIETVDELVLLESLGCQSVQGYLIALPMPANAVEPWLIKDRARIRILCGKSREGTPGTDK